MRYIKIISALLIAASMLFGLCCCSIKNNQAAETTELTETTSNTAKVTFPEGFTVAEIAARLEENGVCSAADFMAEANNPAYLEEFDIEIENPDARPFLLEGYIFPDTYYFYLNENPASVIKRFLRNFNTKITHEMKSRASELGYTIDEILTLASIVQEEGGIAGEDARISSVLHNRLDSPSFSKLQCDCCSFYLRNSVKPYVSEAEYEQYLQSYSTYNCYGLPEGPITNPGIGSINAALYPEDTDYYFFVTDADKNYLYASTWEQHQKNCSIAGIS